MFCLLKSHEIVYTELATQQNVFCPAPIRDKKKQYKLLEIAFTLFFIF